MVFVRDEGSVYNAPLEEVWGFVGSGTAHSEAHHHRKVERKTLPGNFRRVHLGTGFRGEVRALHDALDVLPAVRDRLRGLRGTVRGFEVLRLLPSAGNEDPGHHRGRLRIPHDPAARLEAAVLGFFALEFEQDSAAITSILSRSDSKIPDPVGRTVGPGRAGPDSVVVTDFGTFKYVYIHIFTPPPDYLYGGTPEKYRTIYLVTAALMVAMVGGYALADDDRDDPEPGSILERDQHAHPGRVANIGSIVSEQLVVLTAGMTGSITAGSQVGAVGLQGNPTTLAVCGAAPCAVQNFKTANPGTETTGNYGEQIVINVIQPATGGTSLGFDFSVTIVASTGTVVVQGYLATGVSTFTSAETIPVYLYVDLGTTTAPVINSLSVVFNQCASATACP